MTVQEFQGLTIEEIETAAAAVLVQLESCAHLLTPEALEARKRATERAVKKLASGARVAYDHASQTARFPSESSPGKLHTTTANGCDCRATIEGKVCWHKPARAMLFVLAEARAVQPCTLYACPWCRSAMIHTETPGGEACVECSNARCQKTYMQGTYDVLEPLSPAESAQVARMLGLPMYPEQFGRAA